MSYLFPLLAAFIWGGNTLVSKMSAGAIPASQIAFLRWLIAAVILLPFALRPLLRHRQVIAANWGKLFILGVMGAAVFQTLAYHAASYTAAINMGVIQALVPLLTILLASLVFRTWPGISTWVGAMVSLLGVLLVISAGDLHRLVEHGLNVGDLMMLLAVMAMAVYNTLLKHWRMALPLLVSIFCQAVCASVVLLPMFLAGDKQAPTPATGGMILYAAIAASVIAPLSWMAGSHRLGPERVSLFFNLIPVVTAALAVLLLSEPITWALWVGGALTLAGVAIVEGLRKPPPAALAVASPGSR